MSLNFAQQENIGFRYVVDALRCDSPYGDARVRSASMRPMKRRLCWRILETCAP
mgnify:CR=1 FL=1